MQILLNDNQINMLNDLRSGNTVDLKNETLRELSRIGLIRFGFDPKTGQAEAKTTKVGINLMNMEIHNRGILYQIKFIINLIKKIWHKLFGQNE